MSTRYTLPSQAATGAQGVTVSLLRSAFHPGQGPDQRHGKEVNMARRYLYSNGGGVIGYMDNRDKYLYRQGGGQPIAYWDYLHRYMYTQDGAVYGYLSPNGKYLYAQSGEVVGYFHPKYEDEGQRSG